MKNTFIIGGQQYGLESLEPTLDQEFVALHAAFLGSAAYRWESLVEAAHAYFSKKSTNGHNHDQFFNNFTILWRRALNAGRFNAAERIWQMACDIAWEWERKNTGRLIHKGTPYYFWGMTAILRGDIDRGYALMHQAVEEDVRELGQEFPNTPALAFATMNAEKLEQAARGWVAKKAKVLDRYLSAYRASTSNALDFKGFNARYLQQPPNRHAVYSMSYVFGRLTKLLQTPEQVLANDFAAQLRMDLIFRLLQIIESSLKAKNPKGRAFKSQAVFLAKEAKLSISDKDLIHVNLQCGKDFQKTLRSLLDEAFVLPSGSCATGLGRDLAVVYACRNYGAHQLVPVPTVSIRSEEIQQAVFNILFLTVETVY